MTFTHQQNILHKEFLDEYIGEHTLDNFIEWCKYEMADVSSSKRLPRLIAPKSLPERWRIIFNRDPLQFFDMVCFNFYIAGQFGAKIPVSEGREAIKAWLEWHDKCIDLLATDSKPSTGHSEAQEYDPNTPTRPYNPPVDNRKCFKCLKEEGHNE